MNNLDAIHKVIDWVMGHGQDARTLDMLRSLQSDIEDEMNGGTMTTQAPGCGPSSPRRGAGDGRCVSV